ncbi:MAG: hypothetical protein AAFO70_00920 [Pseudomonadota bacterium]
MKPSLLWLPYAANIIILVPVVWNMFTGNGPVGVFEGKVEPSHGLTLLVGSLWLSILIGSIIGLFAPQTFAPLLLVQVIYKASWLAAFVWPLYQRGGWEAVPGGITVVFIGIVLVWPFFLWWAWR